jgi:ribosomal-protein-alanine N-acetyltransferase
MLQFNFSPFPVLITDRLVLRQMQMLDAPELFHLRSDKEVMKYIGKPQAASVAEVSTLIETINKGIAANEDIAWAITLKNDSRLIGYIGFWQTNKMHHFSEVGYMLHPDCQGKGLMQEALKVVLEYGFHTMRLHSVQANVDPLNTASIKLLERKGFVREAHFKENYYFNGNFIDSVIYSLLTPLK